MTAQAAASATPVRFKQRPDRALILSLSTARAVTLAVCVLAVVIVMVTTGMTAGLITAVGISPAAGSALLVVDGRALIEWAPDAARFVWRGASGRLRLLAKPDRPAAVGVLPIPGTASQLRVFAAADGAAILHDQAADTDSWTAIASVTGTGFLYADGETQDAATTGFGRALAAIGSDGQIQRIHIIHRTRPDIHEAALTAAPFGGSAPPNPTADVPVSNAALGNGSLPKRFGVPNGSESGGAATIPDVGVKGSGPEYGSAAVVTAYGETLHEHAAGWRHDTLIAITLGGRIARAAIRRAGHGRTAAARVLAAQQAGLAGALESADVVFEKWLTPTDLTGWIVDGFDPESIPIRPRVSDAALSSATAGPMAIVETWSTVRTDSAFHQVQWISQWPRFDTHPAFLAPLILPVGATVTVSLVYEPIPTPVALRQIGRDKTAQASDAALRRRIGTLDTAAQAARSADTLQRETDLAEGHLDMRHSALIAITAATRDDLTDAATRIRQAAAAAGCETRILYGQQLAALNAVVLPAGLRL